MSRPVHAAWLALATFLALAACRQQPEPKIRPEEESHALAPPRAEPPSRSRASRKAQAPGCAGQIPFALNAASFDSNGAGRTFPASRLEAFRIKAESAFRQAADGLCRSGAVKAKAYAPLQRVIVESASGAMDPTFFQDDQTGTGTLVFQWTFAEADLALPERKAIEQGLRCWNDPDRPECGDLGD